MMSHASAITRSSQVHPRSWLYLRRGPWKAYGGCRCSRGWRLRLITRLHLSKIQQPHGLSRPVGLLLHCPSTPLPRSRVKLAVSPEPARQLRQENDAAEFRGIDGDTATCSHNSSDDGRMDRQCDPGNRLGNPSQPRRVGGLPHTIGQRFLPKRSTLIAICLVTTIRCSSRNASDTIIRLL
jgi:hypothetical protein